MAPPPAPDPERLKAGPEQAERLHRYAHDLRNRLAGMRQAMVHLGGGEEGMDPQELLLFGEQQFFKALRETEQLLDDLAVDRSPGTVRTAPVDLSALVRTAVADLAHRTERKQQSVVLSMPDTVAVLGDAHLLRDLVQALVSNASKFSGREATLTISLRPHGRMAVLTVADTGVGLSPADLEQVFVCYAWLSSTSTDGEAQGRSTLARAQQWACAMGGSLAAHSEGPGKGSTFSLNLPLA